MSSWLTLLPLKLWRVGMSVTCGSSLRQRDFYARLRTNRSALEFDLNDNKISKTKITKWFKNSVMRLRTLRVCLWFPWAFLRGVVLCVWVRGAAVHREQLGLHTLEDFHIPRCFVFGDRSPFWKIDFVREVHRAREESVRRPPQQSLVFLFSSVPSAPV